MNVTPAKLPLTCKSQEPDVSDDETLCRRCSNAADVPRLDCVHEAERIAVAMREHG